MIEECASCGQSFLTEADPYVVRPTPQGNKLYCYCHIRGFEEVGGIVAKLESELAEVKERLVEAEKVVAFYAHQNSWVRATTQDTARTIVGDDCDELKGRALYHGGKRARQYQQKYNL